MADEQDSGEKTHEPTARRMQQYREQGQVPRSTDLIGLVILFVGMGGILVMGTGMGRRVMEYFQLIYETIEDSNLDMGGSNYLIALTLECLWDVLALPLFFIWFGAVLIGLIQGQFIIPKEPIKFSPEKIDPISGFKQKFLSSQPLMELFKGVMKLFLLGL